jgi:hypothetical protein
MKGLVRLSWMLISILKWHCDLCVTEGTAEIGCQNNSKAGEIVADVYIHGGTKRISSRETNMLGG